MALRNSKTFKATVRNDKFAKGDYVMDIHDRRVYEVSRTGVSTGKDGAGEKGDELVFAKGLSGPMPAKWFKKITKEQYDERYRGKI